MQGTVRVLEVFFNRRKDQHKITQYKSVILDLSDSRLNKLESTARNIVTSVVIASIKTEYDWCR